MRVQMKSWVLVILMLFTGLVSCKSQKAKTGDGKEASAANESIQVPDGFRIQKIYEDIGSARHVVVRDNGDIYVRLSKVREGKGVAALRDSDEDGAIDEIQYFEDSTGTGVGIHANYLYYSSNQAVFRRQFGERKELIPSGAEQVVVSGFPTQSQHAAKAFAIDHQGGLFVDVGAPSNACQESSRTPGSKGLRPCPQLKRHGGVWRFASDKLNQTQEKDGLRVATGLRNVVAMDWHPQVNELYVVQHGRDQLYQLFPDRFSEEESANLPAEEMFLVKKGFNGGWPYTYFDPHKSQRFIAPEYGGNGAKRPKSGEYADPLIAFPAHWAPNDLLFYSGKQFPKKYQGGAFVAFHGSWNRGSFGQQGYKVAFVPFEGHKPSGSWEVFADGFAGQEKIPSPGAARHRPMGLARDSAGALYIVDSVEGDLWKVTKE